jgi:hypothetical protein
VAELVEAGDADTFGAADPTEAETETDADGGEAATDDDATLEDYL